MRARLSLTTGIWILVARIPSCRPSPLPPIRAEHTAYDSQLRFNEAEIVRSDPNNPPSPGMLFVGIKKKELREGGNRPALILPPPGGAAFEVGIPEIEPVLRFALGLARAGPGVDRAATVRYVVSVDGEEVYRGERSLGPDGRACDWLEGEVPLERWRGRSVRVVFRTECDEPGGEGTLLAGFADSRIVESRRIERRRAARDRLNVLLLVVDTLRTDHLACYGYTRPTAPNLARLAAGGVLFRRAISQAPWTWPATASILTSLYPRAHGVTGPDSCYLVDSIETLAERLQGSGYSTFAISANALIARAHNFDQGFERFEEVPRAEARGLTDRFLAWLEEGRKGAFFAYLHYMDPHDPYTPPEQERIAAAPEMTTPRDGEIFDELARVQRGRSKPLRKLRGKRRYLEALYDGEIRHWDRQLGRILETLGARDLLSRTLILVTSDHGEEFWEHGHRGHGKTLYQELIRVPLVAYLEGALSPGIEERLVETIDLYPTICAAAGVAAPPGIDGQPLPGLSPLPAPRDPGGEAFSSSEAAFRGGEGWTLCDQEAVVTATHKLIRRARGDGAEGPGEQFFDLRADPGERVDLADEDRDPLGDLRREVSKWVRSVRERSRRTDLPWAREAIRRRLGALGYIEQAGRPMKQDRGQIR